MLSVPLANVTYSACTSAIARRGGGATIVIPTTRPAASPPDRQNALLAKGHSPDPPCVVVAHEQGPVRSHEHRHRAAPARAVGELPAGDEILDRDGPAIRERRSQVAEGIGVPRARAEAVRNLARAGMSGLFDHDEQNMVERLVAIPGIGPWTAEYIAMRALGEPDAFPASDLGVRRALGQKGRPVSPGEAERRAEPWRPWRSYAVLHLWRPEGASQVSAPGLAYTP